MKLRDAALLFVLAAIWGAAFLFVRVAVPVLGPFPLVASRLLLGGALLFVHASAIKQTPNWRAHWRRYLMIGIFNNAIPYVLISTAQLHRGGVVRLLLNATTPLFRRRDRRAVDSGSADGAKLIGLGLGIVGVGVIVGWQQQQVDTVWIVSVAADVCLGLLGMGSPPSTARSPSRISRSRRPPGQLLVAGGVSLPFRRAQPAADGHAALDHPGRGRPGDAVDGRRLPDLFSPDRAPPHQRGRCHPAGAVLQQPVGGDFPGRQLHANGSLASSSSWSACCW
ncbi:MAG: DMT family transporter [Chloroflexi bacterium]|nr:DMT family transporter [Chloroflexota bacterium]